MAGQTQGWSWTCRLRIYDTPSHERIQEDGFSPFREFILGFQERRMQIGYVGLTMMIIVVQCQHDSTLLGLVWDLGIACFDSLATIREDSTGFDFLEFNFGRLRSGFLEDWSFKELTKFRQLMIFCLIRRNHVGSCILHTTVVNRGGFTSYRIVWDHDDFTTYGILVFAWRDFGDDVSRYFMDDYWGIAVRWGSWSIRDFPFDTWRLGFTDSLSVCGHIDFSMMYGFRVGLVDFTKIHWMDVILNSGDDSLRHYSLDAYVEDAS
jgi:hypothetical protein